MLIKMPLLIVYIRIFAFLLVFCHIFSTSRPISPTLTIPKPSFTKLILMFLWPIYKQFNNISPIRFAAYIVMSISKFVFWPSPWIISGIITLFLFFSAYTNIISRIDMTITSFDINIFTLSLFTFINVAYIFTWIPRITVASWTLRPSYHHIISFAGSLPAFRIISYTTDFFIVCLLS